MPLPEQSDRRIGENDRARDGAGKCALVTGASSGIGLAFARLLGAKGFDVVAVARREERLEALKSEMKSRWGVDVHPIAVDLTNPGAAKFVAAELERQNLRVDFLVNNAGITLMGRFVEHTWTDLEDYLRVLAYSAVELTHLVLPGMVERGWGRVVSVCSIAAAMQASPSSILYAATKSMMHRFTEGIAQEYASEGIQATASLPGMTATEIFAAGGYQKYVDAHKGAQWTMMQPEDVAREAYAAVMAGRRTIVHGRSNRVAVWLLLHLPIALRRKLATAMTGAIKIEEKRT
jgi:uncharacterized protein